MYAYFNRWMSFLTPGLQYGSVMAVPTAFYMSPDAMQSDTNHTKNNAPICHYAPHPAVWKFRQHTRF
jgi:hypothetical protein